MSSRDGTKSSAPPSSRAPSSNESRATLCMLLVDDRVVLRANGPPDVEYAMFENGDIELRASEPGRVREHGYLTTVERARARLAQAGFDAALARECGLAMQAVIAEAYARGPAVRAVARALGPVELLQAETYDAPSQAYHGTFLDRAALARDLEARGLAQAGFALHAMYLAVLLETEQPTAKVFLATDSFTRTRKPGERTYHRPTLGSARGLVGALAALADERPHPSIAEELPRADVIAFLRSRADTAATDDARALYADLERAVTLRPMPERGPLADPELWAIEARLDSDADLGDIMDAVTTVERTHGRTPGTTYLRARAALALDLEPPKRVAERVSALALSMTSFQELSLLAAEAWLRAGDGRRAMPYARDLVDAPLVDEGLRLKAQRLLARAVGAAPDLKTQADSIPAAKPTARPPDRISEPSPAPTRPSTRPGLGIPELPNESSKPPPLELDLPPPPPPPKDDLASFTLDLPGPETLPRPPSRPPSARPKPRDVERASEIPPSQRGRSSRAPARRRISGVMVEERVHTGLDPRAEPDGEPLPRASIKPSTKPSAWDPGIRNRETMKDTSETTPTPPRGTTSTRPPPRSPALSGPPAATELMAGCTHPAYRVESPAPLLSRAPLFPPGADDEVAEHLSLPAGVAIDPRPIGLEDPPPRSLFEARVVFTRLTRELGVDYRIQRAIALTIDVSGLEAIQAGLLEMFPDRVIDSPIDALELRRHGAFFAEVLARRLDAEWVDIAPAQLGDWSMIVPPDMRVWPFGRVARLVQMGHRERDLVSTYLELEGRARRR